LAFDTAKSALTVAGKHAGPKTLRRLDFLVSYMAVGGWMQKEGHWPRERFADRPALFESLFQRIGHEPVLYLEFGVYQGYSMRLWSKGLRHPDSRLFGFDSFEGLPEFWHADAPAGRFDLGGNMPVIDDPRVSLVKGWFEDSLAEFDIPQHQRMVVNLDADLYSSTKLVLEKVRPELKPGDILYFDEFFDRQNELRAFDEFVAETGIQFKLLGATKTFNEVAFEIEG
jgi:hypothetical protein